MPEIERAAIAAELTPAFDVIAAPEQTAPFVLCSPHSGRVYPRHFLAQSRLDALTLRKSEDSLVDRLFEPVANLGVPLIAARFPRAFIDVNREPYELDPEIIAGTLPEYANVASVRVVGGLGTIARIVADGEEIYRRPLSLKAALERIEALYFPFHDALAGLIEDTRRRFGYCILIDCHSMPSSSMAGTTGPRPDFVVGDRFGASSDVRLTRMLRDLIAGQGYDVQLNRPYAGGYITEHYGRPRSGVHALQIEINRGLYLEETSIAPSPGFASLQRNLVTIASRLFAIAPGHLERRAAE